MSDLNNPQLRTRYDANLDFGLVGDHRVAFDGATTGGTSVITTAAVTMNFTNEDVGRRITLAGAGVGGAVYVGTITSINTTQSVNVSPATTTTVSGKGVQAGTDNTAAINNMVTFVNTTSATYPGILIDFGQSPTNAWGWPVRSVFTKQVTFQGIGGNYNIDSGDYTRTGGTRLAWWSDTEDGGVEFGAWITVEPSAGPQAIIAPAFRQIWFDGRNGDQAQALIALKLAGVFNPILQDVFFIDSKMGVLCEATATVLNPVNSQGVLRPHFQNVNSRLLESFTGAILTPITTSTAITLTNTGQNITVSAATMPTTVNSRYAWIATHIGNPVMVLYTGGGTTTLNVKVSPGDAIYAYATVSGGNVVSVAPNNSPVFSLSGNTTANTNCGLILHGQHSYGSNWGPAAIDYRNSDSLDMQDIYLNGGSDVNDGAINRRRRPGVRFAGHNTDAGLACRNSVVRSGDPGSLGGGGVSSMGLLNTGAKMGFPTGPNYYDLYQLGNGAPVPVVESFASFIWKPNGGLSVDAHNVALASQVITAATLTQLNGSLIVVPQQGFQIGTTFRWTFDMSKTAVGTAGSLFQIRVGALGTTADAIVQAVTTGVGTAAIDTATFCIQFTVTAIGAGTTTGIGHLRIGPRSNASVVAGWIATPGVILAMTPTAFSSPTAGLQYISLALTSGATVAPTMLNMTAELINPANP